jgi:hypothetical protein
MKGQQAIIAARLRGHKPVAIYLEIGLPKPAAPTRYDDPERALEFNLYPTVQLEEAELAHRHDWRFVKHCRVHVHAAHWSDALLALVERLAAADATAVICLAHDSRETLFFHEGDWQAWIS